MLEQMKSFDPWHRGFKIYIYTASSRLNIRPQYSDMTWMCPWFWLVNRRGKTEHNLAASFT